MMKNLNLNEASAYSRKSPYDIYQEWEGISVYKDLIIPDLLKLGARRFTGHRRQGALPTWMARAHLRYGDRANGALGQLNRCAICMKRRFSLSRARPRRRSRN